MPCYRPLQAFQVGSGRPFFSPRLGARALELPCGQCVGCRLDYSRQWAVRCMHENKMHAVSCMLTLTYDDAHLPEYGWLRHSDFVGFMKRFRESQVVYDDFSNRWYLPMSYFMCGEYGGLNGRPHYHALVFGFHPADKVFWKNSDAGFPSYTSKFFDKLWKVGATYVGDVSFESAAYIARYFLKPTFDSSADLLEILDVESGEIYSRPREYLRMSLRPAIGKRWFRKFFSDVFPRDHVLARGVKHAVPRYYSRLLDAFSPLMLADLKAIRREKMDTRMRMLEAEFPELRFQDVRRLDVEERCKLASIRQLKRS